MSNLQEGALDGLGELEGQCVDDISQSRHLATLCPLPVVLVPGLTPDSLTELRLRFSAHLALRSKYDCTPWLSGRVRCTVKISGGDEDNDDGITNGDGTVRAA